MQQKTIKDKQESYDMTAGKQGSKIEKNMK